MRASRGRVAVLATNSAFLHPVSRNWFSCFLFAALILLAPHAIAQEQILLEAGATMSYLDNSVDPGLVGLEWTTDSFVDTWPSGTYGVGYDTEGSASNLINTVVPDFTLSIFTRATFNVTNPGSISTLHF